VSSVVVESSFSALLADLALFGLLSSSCGGVGGVVLNVRTTGIRRFQLVLVVENE